MDVRKLVQSTIDSIQQELIDLSLKLHDHPEISNQEIKAHEWLSDYIESKGFSVIRSAYNIPTAFRADFGPEGENVPCISFCSEYDALPGLGHACGHNLIAIVGLACAIACKEVSELIKTPYRVTLFGTPAEGKLYKDSPLETTGGKINLIDAGAFKEVDICIMAHPGPENIVYGSWLALQTLKIEYFGKSSHASAAPWDGINALDAAVSAYTNLSHLRQQILPTDRIHGIISHGGDAPNIIPSYCKMEYYIRSKTLSQLKKLQPRVTSCFRAAALSSGCTVEVSPGSTMGDVVGNSVLGQLYESEMIGLGVKMSKDPDHKPRGSTDMGNVTHHLPGLHPLFSLSYDGELDFSYHTTDFAKHTRSNEAMKCAIRCSKALAFTGISCVLDPDLMKKAKLEFVKSSEVSDK